MSIMDRLINQDTGEIDDDHYYINTIAQVPMIDIVQYETSAGFGSFHHTTQDNMNVINKRTLEAVGNTLLYVVYQED